MFAVYGILGDLAAWKVRLQAVTVMCLQIWELPKINQNREVWMCFQMSDSDPGSGAYLFHQPKLQLAEAAEGKDEDFGHTLEILYFCSVGCTMPTCDCNVVPSSLSNTFMYH